MKKSRQDLQASRRSRQASHASRRLGGPLIWLLCTALVGTVAMLTTAFWPSPSPPATVPGAATIWASAPTYVGGQACAKCHKQESLAWKNSHHDQAMKVADAASVLGDFNNATFEYEGIRSRFYRRGGKYFVETDGPDGKLAEFEVKYTFGVTPLQQYLLELPGGRYQALSISWDARPREQGGQRWFHLYPGEHVTATDVLHWTKPSQNWNNQCAECHSTNLRKNYLADQDRYSTSFSEINVSCEACHGPGSRHVDWAKRAGKKHAPNLKAADVGLVADFSDRAQTSWVMDPVRGIATRATPVTSRAEIEMCARCHARRGTLFEDVTPGEPLLNTHRPSLLDEGLYRADGQMQDEVYNYGSFLQSKMYAGGVTCSNCHEPHNLKLRGSGNSVCSQCHLPAKFDTPQHTFHKEGSTGAACAACHMPTETYMVVDPRHDHSFRIPRPDLSVSLSVPNACNQCHQDQTPAWAQEAMNRWYGLEWTKRPQFATAIHAGRTAGPNAQALLNALAADTSVPPIARASAISLLPAYQSRESASSIDRAASDVDPLVRLAAVEAAEQLPPDLSAAIATRLLRDSVRVIRAEAARALVGESEQRLDGADLASFQKALAEYLQAQSENLDRPDAHMNLAILHLRRSEFEEARREYEAAVRVAPWFIPAHLNLADLLRHQGHEDQAEREIRAALVIDPSSADAHYALGLSLVRQKKLPDAIDQLRQAAELAPLNPQYPYAYALALQSAGREGESLEVLKRAHERTPRDRGLLAALIELCRNQGDVASARRYAQALVDLSPDDPEARALLNSLGAQP